MVKAAMPRALWRSLLWLTLLSVPGLARADASRCPEFERRHAALGRDALSLQVNNLLFVAAENGCESLVRTLLAEGASLQARDREGDAALSRAAQGGAGGVARILIERGADIDQRNLKGSTPLFLAVEQNRAPMVRLLLQAGADVNLPGRSAVPPLAAAAYQGNLRIIDALLQRGADVSAADSTGKTALLYAAARGFGDVVDRLLGTGIDVNRRYGNDLTVLMWAAGHADDVPEQDGVNLVQALIARGAHLDDADDRGRTPLMIAAERGHVAIARELIEAGARADLRDKLGKKAVDLAPDEATRQSLPGN